jgi:parallel beta-helix repeat protein
MKYKKTPQPLGQLLSRKGRNLALLALSAIAAGSGLPSAKGQTFDIRSFGARCNGGDDSAAVNNAFNSLPDGATLQISCQAGVGPSGLLLHNKTGVTVVGVSGGGFVGLAQNPSKILFRTEVCNNCTIRNLTINANRVGAAGLSIYWSSNSVIQNNVVTSVGYPASAGIIGMGNSGNQYVGNTVNTTTGTSTDGTRGIWVGNPSDELLEYNPVISNNTVTNIAATGIVVHAIGATVDGNNVDGTQGAGVKLEPPLGMGGQTVVQNSTFRHNLFHGVQVEDADSPVIIQNNTIDQNTIAGVYVSGGAFVNGQILNNTISANGQAGIYLYDANGVNIQSNLVTTGGNGIILEADYPGAIRNVQINNNTITSVGGDGISVWGRGGTITGVAVSSNSIYKNARYGMEVEEQSAGAVTGVSLSGNCFSGNGVGALLDIRPTNRLSPPQVSSSCSGSTGTQTTSQVNTGGSSSSSSSSFTPIRINAGGGQYTDPSGTVWSADTGYAGGFAYSVNSQIANTSSQALYRSCRWNSGVLDYNFSVASGTRTVTLKFAETYFTSPGRRVFSVWINGQQVIANLDIVGQVGMNTALDQTFTVQSSGQIAIHMVGSKDDPMVSGIEIK